MRFPPLASERQEFNAARRSMTEALGRDKQLGPAELRHKRAVLWQRALDEHERAGRPAAIDWHVRAGALLKIVQLGVWRCEGVTPALRNIHAVRCALMSEFNQTVREGWDVGPYFIEEFGNALAPDAYNVQRSLPDWPGPLPPEEALALRRGVGLALAELLPMLPGRVRPELIVGVSAMADHRIERIAGHIAPEGAMLAAD